MKRRIRYSIIGSGLVIFAVLAPLIVLYVIGVHYNRLTSSYVQTGILSIITDPKNTNVKLTGMTDRSTTTPVNFRFLPAGEYTVTLSKAGYFDWSKRFRVDAGKATIASGALDSIYLVKNTGIIPHSCPNWRASSVCWPKCSSLRPRGKPNIAG